MSTCLFVIRWIQNKLDRLRLYIDVSESVSVCVLVIKYYKHMTESKTEWLPVSHRRCVYFICVLQIKSQPLLFSPFLLRINFIYFTFERNESSPSTTQNSTLFIYQLFICWVINYFQSLAVFFFFLNTRKIGYSKIKCSFIQILFSCNFSFSSSFVAFNGDNFLVNELCNVVLFAHFKFSHHWQNTRTHVIRCVDSKEAKRRLSMTYIKVN